jgi:orotate phosphoribosyltransferase
MENYKNAFIEFLYENQALLFGSFTLKSGRQSPYFFNMGLFNNGASLMRLGEIYASALQETGFEYDFLFGPAYKGIPLVCTTAIGLNARFAKNVPYSFNRKEKKAHGDQGQFVGAPMIGNMVMVDDVITAGTTVRETLAMIESLPVKLQGILIAFDRQERGQGERSAIQEVIQEYQIPVRSIVTLKDVLEYMHTRQELRQYIPAVESYRYQFGARLK